MGWHAVNEMLLERDFITGEIIITWTDAVTGNREERFKFKDEKEAMKFAVTEFTQETQ